MERTGTKKSRNRKKDIYLERKGMGEGTTQQTSQTSDRGKGVHAAVCQRERR